ncbi:hypothetical protein FA95DRAFT_1500162 [Auriscalpium vulgare]|uniref:Uncharacterized protein n=1 Tax=Auriscalpium vulgare TaxID=40419 RepID=A0ACB8REQ5_9AGAM|nr:hypothetical protein FA95DRAFT_1500162 [Auriscalpium vulgare]
MLRQRKKTRVLGRGRLAAIHEDMNTTMLPSWVSRAPSNAGSSTHGKFSADQWRTWCTIHLVITLIRLWGCLPEQSREFQMLANFMDLVSATKLATMRSMTVDREDQFYEFMMNYLRRLKILFPGVRLKPNDHFSVHLPTFLKRFGPSHAWRSFAFERWNYMLQQIKTNGRFGDMEKTMYERFCMGQKLRQIMHRNRLGEELQHLLPAYSRVSSGDVRGTFLNDMLAMEETSSSISDITPPDQSEVPIPDDILRLLVPQLSVTDAAGRKRAPRKSYVRRMQIRMRGVLFHTFSSAPRDSFVAIGTSGMDDWRPARIASIIQHTQVLSRVPETTTVFFLVQTFKPLSEEDAAHDPYRRFPIAGGRLYYDRMEETSLLVPVKDVICHIAMTPMRWEGIEESCIHALPIDRVRHSCLYH